MTIRTRGQAGAGHPPPASPSGAAAPRGTPSLDEGSRASALTIRSRTRTLFVALVAGFLALSTAVPISVAPQLVSVRRIHVDAGQRLRLLARMRGTALKLRTASFLTLAPDARDAQAEIDQDAAELSTLATQFDAVAPAGASGDEWRRARDHALPELLRLASGWARSSRGGGVRAETLRRLVGASTALDGALERLSAAEDASIAQLSERTHRSLLVLIIACIAVGIAGGLLGTVFLRRELQLVHAFAQEAERRISDLDAFAGRVAHDLRNPLQTVFLGLRILRRECPPKLGSEVLDRTERAAVRLEQTIRGLLDFSRHGRSTEGPAYADLSAVIHGVVEELGVRAERAGVALRAEVARSVSVAMPESAIRSVIANLVDNGIKYAAPRDDRFVAVRADAGSETAWIRVSDNGLGIPREKVPRVFEPFFRASDGPDGYGIGLATVKRLLDAHGGEIEVDSRTGDGTTFLVKVPIQPVQPRAMQ